MSSSKNNSTADPAHQLVKYHTPFVLSGKEHEVSGCIYRLAGKEDCYTFRNFADSLEGFSLRYNKNGTLVWDRKMEGEPMHVIKVFGVFPDATPSELYDMLHDAIFREKWDTFRQEAFRIVRLDDHNDIGYYAAKSPMAMLANRDFVNQRSWHDAGRGEYVIFNTSVPHVAVSPSYQKDVHKNKHGTYVRALSKLTGYLIRPWTDPETGNQGACLTYVTQSDPCGWIPASLTNYITTKFAPKTIENVRAALKIFRDWFPQQVAANTYEKDWDTPSSWWTEAPDVPNATIEFALTNRSVSKK